MGSLLLGAPVVVAVGAEAACGIAGFVSVGAFVELIVSVFVGAGLSAAAGFSVGLFLFLFLKLCQKPFRPFLTCSAASGAVLQVSESFYAMGLRVY